MFVNFFAGEGRQSTNLGIAVSSPLTGSYVPQETCTETCTRKLRKFLASTEILM